MFYNLFNAHTFCVGLGILTVYFLIISVVFGKKLLALFGKHRPQPILQTSTFQPDRKNWSKEDLLPPLIDKPADHPSEQAGMYHPAEENDEPAFELIEDDGATTLLKEAEKVVEQIQDTVNHIESHPANPEEVYSKIRAIVSEYRLFIDTEYFDAINSFIAVTVQRDCDLALTEDDLKTLWYSQAA